MNRKTNISAVLLKKYCDALHEIKNLTNKEEGATIRVTDWTHERGIDRTMFLTMYEKLKWLSRGATSEGTTSNTYRWLLGDTPIDDKLATKLIETIRKRTSDIMSKSGKKKLKETGVEHIEGNNKSTKRSSTGITENGLFTVKHLNVIKKLDFDVPTDIDLDRSLHFKGVTKVTFDVDKSTVTMRLFMKKLSEQLEEGLTEVAAIELNNKALQLSPRFDDGKTGAYSINTVDYTLSL